MNKEDNTDSFYAFSEEDNAFFQEGEGGEALAQKYTKLKQELALARKDKEEYLSGWQRCKADAINIKQDNEKKWAEAVKFAESQLLAELCSIVNMFHHAFDGQDTTNPYIKGFRHIYDQLSALLIQHGATFIEAVGVPFNAALHEAIESIPVLNKEQDGVILEELEKGFILYGKVITPSKVKVGVYTEP